jgi:hypothetical protein
MSMDPLPVWEKSYSSFKIPLCIFTANDWFPDIVAAICEFD